MFRVAIVLGLSLGCAAGPAPEDEVTKRVAEKVKVTTERVLSVAGKSVANFKGKLAALSGGQWPRKVGRRLQGGGQCAWSASACSPDATYLSNLMPSSGSWRVMWDADMACTAVTTEGTCEETKVGSYRCSWSGKKCGLELDSAMENLVGSVLDSSGCGWMEPVFEGGKCGMKAASDSDCSAANKCETTREYVLANESGSCSMSDVCAMSSDMALVYCPAGSDIDMSNSSWMADKTVECMLAKPLPDDLDPSDFNAVALHLASCLYEGCPNLLELATSQGKAALHCSAKTKGSCSADTQCDWDSSEGECNPGSAQLMLSVPDTCKIKALMVASSECPGRSQSQCTGSCEWDTNQKCSGSKRVTSSKCETTAEKLYRDLAQGGNKDALSLLNAKLVGANCEAQTDEASCTSAVQKLETTTPEAGRAPRTTDTTFGIAMIGLVFFAN